MTTPPTLTFNRETGRYEGYLHIEVDAEIFRRLLLKAVEENTMADLTDPQTWATAVASVGQIRPWLDKPHVTVTPIASLPLVAPVVPKGEVPPSQDTQKRTKMQLLEEQVRERARKVPPHVWDPQCLTPIADQSLPDKVREDIGRLRYDERTILKKLRAEWETGSFVLDAEAEASERDHQAGQETKLTTMMKTVEGVVNGNRFR